MVKYNVGFTHHEAADEEKTGKMYTIIYETPCQVPHLD